MLIKDIQLFTTTHPTRQYLVDILLDAVQQWLSGNPVVLTGYPELYSELIHNQTWVGWEQIFLGRFVTEWSELQQEFLKSKSNKKKKHSGTTWVTGVTSVIWKNVYIVWDERNGQQHGLDAIAKENKLNEMALKQIEAL